MAKFEEGPDNGEAPAAAVADVRLEIEMGPEDWEMVDAREVPTVEELEQRFSEKVQSPPPVVIAAEEEEGTGTPPAVQTGGATGKVDEPTEEVLQSTPGPEPAGRVQKEVQRLESRFLAETSASGQKRVRRMKRANKSEAARPMWR